ncbi:cold-shock protein [Myroides sp. C15-4]|uniref:cold-shock protein n=1 Tax=Myroides sp. C15-4 TaxID=3400532 RepID=UPI003D2F6970
MQEGKVKFFNESKGFGFIAQTNGSGDIFVHTTGLLDNICENDDVVFDLQHSHKGLIAVNVKRK